MLGGKREVVGGDGIEIDGERGGVCGLDMYECTGGGCFNIALKGACEEELNDWAFVVNLVEKGGSVME